MICEGSSKLHSIAIRYCTHHNRPSKNTGALKWWNSLLFFSSFFATYSAPQFTDTKREKNIESVAFCLPVERRLAHELRAANTLEYRTAEA